jgi:Domain of unknown function (DUF4365)
MPKRTASHVIEDESRRAFAALVPGEWVIRPVVPDYGIDKEVEVYDKNGLPTGLMFFVQLKATDTPELEAGLKLALKISTMEYYRTLELPVMIVRYHRPTGRFFWRWSHEFKERPATPAAKTVTVRIPPSAEWKEQTATEVEASLRVFRQLKASAPPHPIIFTLVISGAEVHGMPSSVFRSALLDAASTSAGIVRFTDDVPVGAHPEAAISSERLTVSLAGLRSLTLNAGQGYPTDLARTRFAHDVLSAIAYVLATAGFSNEAAEIAANHLDAGTLFSSPEVCFRVLSAMARARRVSDALRLARKLINAAKGPQLIAQLLTVARFHPDSLTEAEFDYLHEVMQLFIKKATELGDRATAAVAHYNLGNQLRSQGEKYRRAAFREYRLAAASDPGYLERPYFWKELAGVLFLSCHYRFSAAAYRKAVELGGDAMCTALLADALAFSGEYREALGLFRDYIRRERKADAEWRLKAFMLGVVVDDLGIERQKRNTTLANRLADVKGLGNGEALNRLEAAIHADALCAFAWYNRAAKQAESGEPQEIFLSYLFAAICRPSDIEAWSLALLNSLNSRQNAALTIWSAQMAYRRNGHAFLQGLEKLAREKLPQAPITDLMNVAGEAVKQVDRIKGLNVIRILGEGANYKEIFLGDEQK